MANVLGCLKLDFALHTSCWWQHKSMIAEKVERVELGHPLGDRIWQLLHLALGRLPFAHLGTKNVFSHLVETPFLALYMDFGVDG